MLRFQILIYSFHLIQRVKGGRDGLLGIKGSGVIFLSLEDLHNYNIKYIEKKSSEGGGQFKQKTINICEKAAAYNKRSIDLWRYKLFSISQMFLIFNPIYGEERGGASAPQRKIIPSNMKNILFTIISNLPVTGNLRFLNQVGTKYIRLLQVYDQVMFNG